jgi:DinB superfamily
MSPTEADIAEILGILADTPAHITRACEGREESLLADRPDEHVWTVRDNLAHLRASADVWGASIEAMLKEDGATQRHISPRGYLRESGYAGLDTSTLLAAFTAQRKALLITLHSLDPAKWSRWTRIDGRTHTVFTQARRMALHERAHLAQIDETLDIQLS